MPGHFLLSIVLKLTSSSLTPPQVTNSSLYVLLPWIWYLLACKISVRELIFLLEIVDQRWSDKIPDISAKDFHKFLGSSTGESVAICFTACDALCCINK